MFALERDVSELRRHAPLLRVVGLKRYFEVSPSLFNRLIGGSPRQIVRAVDGVSFSIDRGKTFGLVGESGCGKSTVASLIVGLGRPTVGQIEFDGVDFSYGARRHVRKALQARMQMIFQNPYTSLNGRWRVSDIIAEPIKVRASLTDRRAIRDRVADLLQQVGLSPDDWKRYPHEFSGGQRQRIAIARALAGEPELLVCDEPTSALDVSVQAQILNLIRDLQRQHGLTALFISHNLATVYFLATTVGVMYLGRLCEVANKESLFARPRHPYTQMLLDAVPSVFQTRRWRVPPTGEAPSPISPPSGCTFHPRCPHADTRCRIEQPTLTAR